MLKTYTFNDNESNIPQDFQYYFLEKSIDKLKLRKKIIIDKNGVRKFIWVDPSQEGSLATHKSDKEELSNEELLKRYQNTENKEKSDEIKSKIVNNNMALIGSIAKKFQNRGIDFEDLISAGKAGLLEAINKFKFSEGKKLSTYATSWIEQKIRREIINYGSLLRHSEHMYYKIRNVNKIINTLIQKYDREPTKQEIIKYAIEEDYDLDPNEIDDVLQAKGAQNIASLQTRVGGSDDGKSQSLEEMQVDYEETPMDERVVGGIDMENMIKKIKSDYLNEKENKIFDIMFINGLNPTEAYREYGEKLGINSPQIFGKIANVIEQKIKTFASENKHLIDKCLKMMSIQKSSFNNYYSKAINKIMSIINVNNDKEIFTKNIKTFFDRKYKLTSDVDFIKQFNEGHDKMNLANYKINHGDKNLVM